MQNSCTSLPKIKITISAKKDKLNSRFMMEMGCFFVYTQKIHSPDPRSFIHCFISKLHLMSSWAHLNRDKLITWEFFHPVCSSPARLLDGPSTRSMQFKKSWNLFCSITMRRPVKLAHFNRDGFKKTLNLKFAWI